MGYTFSMTFHELTCFLKKASCSLADKVSKLVKAKQSGIAKKECVAKAELLEEYIEMLECWDVTQTEKRAYAVIHFSSIANNEIFTLTINGYSSPTIYQYQFDIGQPLSVNLQNFADYINNDDDIIAEVNGDNMWLYAPCGYNGVEITMDNTGVITLYDVYVPYFQDGCCPCDYTPFDKGIFLLQENGNFLLQEDGYKIVY